MRDVFHRFTGAFTLRDWIDVLAGAALLCAVLGLALAHDISWLLAIGVASAYGWLLVWVRSRVQSRSAFRHVSHADMVSSDKKSISEMQPALAAAYWIFVVIVLGVVMLLAALLQLASKPVSTWLVFLLSMAIVLIGFGVLGMVFLFRGQK